MKFCPGSGGTPRAFPGSHRVPTPAPQGPPLSTTLHGHARPHDVTTERSPRPQPRPTEGSVGFSPAPRPRCTQLRLRDSPAFPSLCSADIGRGGANATVPEAHWLPLGPLRVLVLPRTRLPLHPPCPGAPSGTARGGAVSRPRSRPSAAGAAPDPGGAAAAGAAASPLRYVRGSSPRSPHPAPPGLPPVLRYGHERPLLLPR